MGNSQMKQALDVRNYRIDCGFYMRDTRLRPISLEWDRKEGDDRTYHRYKWKFGPHRGELLYPFQTPKSKVFIDILHELGFKDADNSDLWRGTIQVFRHDIRNMLAFVRPASDHKAGDFNVRDTPELYVDNGMLEPVELSQIRNLFPNPDNADDVTFHGSQVYFKGANKGTIVYRPQTKPLDVFRLALSKIGYYKISAGHFRSGFIVVNQQRIPILTFQVHKKF